ncbi:MAG: pyridoxal phosphate-dependent aminotransferase [Candidatus Gottesmanbacteria bacterium]|nr:pyridoxal phosphate-dependent aminotransferase [Candidatus Gottesmanbacteria bacterium]
MTSQRLSSVPASPIRKLVPYATAAKKAGVKVYHFNIGDPDIKTPEVMLQVLRDWDRNPVGYSQSQGEPSLLESLKIYYHGLGAIFLDTSHLQVTIGGSEAISWALFAVADPGDEIIVFEPFYANYNTYAAVNGVQLVPIPTNLSDGFHLPAQSVIEGKITKKTKAILYCNPNNPTGTVYSKSEIETLVALAKKHGLFLLSDEVYREFTYDGARQVSLLSFMQEIPEHAIVLDSLSKRYSVCGARIGALISLNQDIMAGVLRIGQGRLSAGLIDQLMAAKLTKVPVSYFQEVHDEYEKRRDVLYEGLRHIPGVTIPKPEGAFYAIVGLPVEDAEHFCQWLLTDFRDPSPSADGSGQAETVMVAPAAGFYATPGKGKNEVRIAYVLSIPDIIRCIDILTKALNAYHP